MSPLALSRTGRRTRVPAPPWGEGHMPGVVRQDGSSARRIARPPRLVKSHSQLYRSVEVRHLGKQDFLFELRSQSANKLKA